MPSHTQTPTCLYCFQGNRRKRGWRWSHDIIIGEISQPATGCYHQHQCDFFQAIQPNWRIHWSWSWRFNYWRCCSWWRCPRRSHRRSRHDFISNQHKFDHSRGCRSYQYIWRQPTTSAAIPTAAIPITTIPTAAIPATTVPTTAIPDGPESIYYDSSLPSADLLATLQRPLRELLHWPVWPADMLRKVLELVQYLLQPLLWAALVDSLPSGLASFGRYPHKRVLWTQGLQGRSQLTEERLIGLGFRLQLQLWFWLRLGI